MQPENFQKIFNISGEILDRLKAYEALLIKWQKSINLISPNTLDHIWHRHFYDSAQLLTYIPQTINEILDVGSGAGFPGLVLAIMRPDLKMTLVESDQRKAEFLRSVSRETGGCIVIQNDRLERADLNNPRYVTARAFAPLTEIFDYFRHLPDYPEFLLLKGKTYRQEVEAAQKFYNFTLNIHKSKTDPNSAILHISDTKPIAK